MTNKCIRAIISGRVQGVFFRDSTRRQALRLELQGQAINLRDGTVEVTACGKEANIVQLIDWLQHGPEYAQVTNVAIHETKDPGLSGFTTG